MIINSALFLFSKLCWLSLYVLTLSIRSFIKEREEKVYWSGMMREEQEPETCPFVKTPGCDKSVLTYKLL